MACDTVFDAFRLATEYLGPELFKRASYRGIWLDLIQREEYKRGAGLTLSTFTVGRSEPTSDEETWVRRSAASDAKGSCGTTWNDVNYGHTETTYNPEEFGLRGPTICQDDLIYNWSAERFLELYLLALAKRSRRSIENRYLNIYSHFVPKNVTDASFTSYAGSTASPPLTGPDLLAYNEATCELTQEMLDTSAAELNEEGAQEGNSNGWITLGESGPIYPLYIGQEASQRILTNNAAVRQDRRDADSSKGDAAKLFNRMGATMVIKSFRHVINLFPPRYVYDGAAFDYIRVPTWVMTASSKGNVAQINPQWRSAPFEAAYVLSPWVFRSEVIRPVNAAAGLNWDPKTYFGEWKWVTGGSIINSTIGDDGDGVDCYDPIGKLGRHFAEYKYAPRPIYNDFGRMFIFRRCPTTEFSCPTCAS